MNPEKQMHAFAQQAAQMGEQAQAALAATTPGSEAHQGWLVVAGSLATLNFILDAVLDPYAPALYDRATGQPCTS